jgi:hypothetical protein
MKKLFLRARKNIFDAPPDNLVRVYSYQHVNAYEAAKETGFFTGNHPYRYEEYSDAYTWMRDQMSVRISDFSGEYPVWAYLKRPNLKADPIPKDELLITALVPRKRMLLSDYNKWHHPLNDWPIYKDQAEEDIRKDEPPSNTWDRCFEITNAPSEWWGAGNYVQACLDRIYLSEIVRVKSPIRRR